MTLEERINEALSPIIAKMREHGATDEMCQLYSNGFRVGSMWADAHPHWISVENELPKDFKIVEDSFYAGKYEETDIVMVAFDDGDFGFARYVHDFPNAEEGEAWYWFAEGNLSGVNLDDGEITHWMPLPQPPKKGGEE